MSMSPILPAVPVTEKKQVLPAVPVTVNEQAPAGPTRMPRISITQLLNNLEPIRASLITQGRSITPLNLSPHHDLLKLNIGGRRQGDWRIIKIYE